MLDRDGRRSESSTRSIDEAHACEPEWGLVHTGLFGGKSSFVPLRGAGAEGDDVRVEYAKDQVKDAPSIDADRQLSEQEEHALYRHYGFEYGAGADTGGGRDVSGPATDDAMTRSEEELHVGTAERESGRVRLRKYVVTEDVETTVPVRREEVRLEREPITDANADAAMSGPEISEEEHEVTLREEPGREGTVPKERVRLEKGVETGEETISDSVRKERVETDGDV